MRRSVADDQFARLVVLKSSHPRCEHSTLVVVVVVVVGVPLVGSDSIQRAVETSNSVSDRGYTVNQCEKIYT